MFKRVSLGMIRAIVYGIVFLLTMIVVSKFINKGISDMTAQMPSATLPVVSFVMSGEHMNCLYGYAQEMDTALQRDTIQPVGEDRRLEFQLDKYGQSISGIHYQIRNVEGDRLIEDSEVLEYRESKGQIFGEMVLKDLIESGKEYELVLRVTLGSGQDIFFYTRILPSESLHVTEKVQFVRDFHEKTFDKERAAELTMYLESNRYGDNTSLGRVDIHSSLDQVTWADCKVTRESEGIVLIKEIDAQTGSFQLNYVVTDREGRHKRNYLVQENYRVRYSKDRMYLLDFERTMEQLFDENAPVYTNNKIELGIQKDEIRMKEDDSGSILAFCVGGSLYSFNTVSNKLAVLYSFWDEKNWDMRTYHDDHDIRILNVDEGGNVQFMVSGYMNRGKHEGRVGIAVYQYNASLNTIEEAVFIPYDKSYQILKIQLDQINYLSKNNDFFFMLEDCVYSIHLDSLTLEVVAAGIKEGSYQVSDDDKMFAWQEYSGELPTALKLKNLTTMEEYRIEAGEGKAVIPFGFMGDDLIYGIGAKEDILVKPDGDVVYLAGEVRIEDEQHRLLKRFIPEESFVMECNVRENQIVLSCVRRLDNGNYVEAADEQIMSAQQTKSRVNNLEDVITEHYQKIYQIALKNNIDTKALKILTPKEVIFEGMRELTPSNPSETEHFYVYQLGRVLGAYQKPSKAVIQAYANAGCVVAQDGSYIWKKGARSTKNQIMAIQGGVKADETNSRLAVCLDAILEFTGTPRHSQKLLDQGQSAMSILTKVLTDYRILDLSGNEIDALLYYVNQDYPVLAISHETDDAMLLIGYNEFNIVVMDPKKGTVYKKGMNDSREYFEDGSWQFITYLPPE